MLLCETPTGQVGRPSKALSFGQAQSILDAATGSTMAAYAIVALLTGARTEELRALTWSHVDLDGDQGASPSVLPHMMVWRSVRAGGDTKTPQVTSHARAAGALCRGIARATRP